MVYKKHIELATRLIKKYGTAGRLEQIREVKNEDMPWEASESIKIYYQCDLVILPINNNQSNLNAASVFEYEEEIYISPTLEVKPKPDDRVFIGEISYVIKNVKELNPNTREKILYICGVSK